MSLKQIIKDIVSFLFCLIKPYPAKGVILMYHSIGQGNLFFNVQPEYFIKQMAYLKNRQFKVISLKDLIERLIREQPIPKKTVVLTFDDGYQDNYSNVWPVLKEHNFPATIFLIPGLVGQQPGDSPKIILKMLDWPEIQEMHQSGLVDFEPHTFTHQRLTRIDLAEAEKEIRQSKKIIEERLHKTCEFFAYPAGQFNQEIIDLLRRLGFKAGLTTEPGLISRKTDLFRLPRQSVNSRTSLIQFKAKLKV